MLKDFEKLLAIYRRYSSLPIVHCHTAGCHLMVLRKLTFNMLRTLQACAKPEAKIFANLHLVSTALLLPLGYRLNEHSTVLRMAILTMIDHYSPF